MTDTITLPRAVIEQALKAIHTGSNQDMVNAEDSLRAALSQQAEPNAGWITAADEEMVGAHLGVANLSDSYESAKSKLSQLIDWHVAVATDPAVNGGLSLQPVAQPVREPLQDALAWELWLNAVDTANNTGRLVAYTYKEAIERAHNIRGEK